MNVYEPEGGFPEHLASRAGVLAEQKEPGLRSRVAAGILNEFAELYRAEDFEGFVPEYQKRSMLTGRTVRVEAGELNGRTVRVLGIGDDLSLEVLTQDGRVERIRAGEVSLRVLS